MRITIPVAKVLAALLIEPDAERYGLDLMKITDLPSGTLYPVLHRLQDAGWLSADWEAIDPAAQGRPARRYYRLTAEGVSAARQALAELHAVTRPVPGVLGGSGSSTGAPAW
jgi:DNA-binding PadR family transcriptional regulator